METPKARRTIPGDLALRHRVLDGSDSHPTPPRLSEPIRRVSSSLLEASADSCADTESIDSYQGGGGAPSLATSSNSLNSQWKVGLELSLPTQRRLIRKPLPGIPGSNPPADRADSRARDLDGEARRLEEEQRLAGAWWPSSLPEPDTSPFGKVADQDGVPAGAGPGLDDQSSQHLALLLHCAAQSSGLLVQADRDLAASLLSDLTRSVLESISWISNKELLASLQRTASIRWRAEAQIRAAAALDSSAASNTASTTSRWARFAWPAAALGKAYREAHRETPVSISLAPSLGIAPGRHLLYGEQRIRKRDVAIRILSNAVWFARHYGSAQGVESLVVSSMGAGDSIDSDEDGKKDSLPTAVSAVSALPPPPPIKKGGLPNFISKTSATIALSGTVTPESGISSSSASQVDVGKQPPPRSGEGQLMSKEISSNAKKHSKAIEQLSSLSAASGHALQAQAKAMGTEDDASSIRSRTASVNIPILSRPGMSEAEAAETAALELAEKEFAEKVDKGCQEWAKMVVCRLCVHFVGVAIPPIEGEMSNKSGSAFSTRSDQTVRDDNLERDEARLVDWRPDVFEGDDIFEQGWNTANAARSDLDSERIKFVGGTFFVHSHDPSERSRIKRLLEVLLYAGCSMILEAAMLADSGAPRQNPSTYPNGQHAFLTSSTEKELPQVGGGEISEATAAMGSTPSPAEGSKSSTPKASRRWTKGLWSIFQTGGANGGSEITPATEAESSIISRAARSSLNLVRTSTGGEVESLSRRPSLGMPRSKTRDERRSGSSGAKKNPIGLSWSSSSHHSREPSDPSSLGSKANLRITRLMSALSKAHGRSESIDEEPVARFSLSDDIDPESQVKEVDSKFSTIKPPLPPKEAFRSIIHQQGPWPVTTSPELFKAGFGKIARAKSTGFYLSFLSKQSITLLLEGREPITFATASDRWQRSTKPAASYASSTPSASEAAAKLKNSHSGAPAPSLTAVGDPSLNAKVTSSVAGGRQDTVAFFNRMAKSQDTPLGQVIEEMCVRACSLEAESNLANPDDRNKAKKAKKGEKAKEAESPAKSNGDKSLYDAPKPTMSFIQGRFKVTVSATVLPASLARTLAGWQESSSSTRNHQPSDAGDSGSIVSSVYSAGDVLTSSRSEETDIAAVAAALHTDRESAKTAVAVAETAVQVAERGGTISLVEGSPGLDSGLWMWNANVRNSWQSSARRMSESTYLMSFARYLEALLYHPALRDADDLHPKTLEEAKAKLKLGDADISGGKEKAGQVNFDIARMFRLGTALVKIQVHPIVVYDLMIEGPVLIPSRSRKGPQNQAKRAEEAERRKAQTVEDGEILETTRLEIQAFFASVKRHIGALEDIFVARELDDKGLTIKSKRLNSISLTDLGSDAASSSASSSSAFSIINSDRRVSIRGSDCDLPIQGASAEPLSLLNRLKSSLRADEFELYQALKFVQADHVNDIRKAFGDRSKSAKNRLGAWVRKHLTKEELAKVGTLNFEEPDYFKPGRHAFPGSRYVVREDEPLSIIAFSLSSRDFKAELGSLKAPSGGGQSNDKTSQVLHWRDGIVGNAGSQISSSASSVSYSSSPLRDKASRGAAGGPPSAAGHLDPDRDEVFYEPEPVQTAMKRKKRGRETSILSLTLRRVGSTVSSQGLESMGTQTPSTEHPPSFNAAEALPGICDDAHGATTVDDEASSFSVDGQVSPPCPSLKPRESVASISSSRQGATAASTSAQTFEPSTIGSSGTDSTFRAHITQVSGRPASLASLFSKDTADTDTVGGGENWSVAGSQMESSTSPSNQTNFFRNKQESRPNPTISPTAAREIRDKGSNADLSGRNVSNGLAAGATTAPTSTAASQTSTRSRPQSSNHNHSRLATTTLGSEQQPTPTTTTTSANRHAESPHIKHNLIHSNTKVSCVSWFAEEFQALRKAWGVDEEGDFARSLSRCRAWSASGGKSKSAFLRTLDQKYVAKQLLAVWSVDEKEAFLEFAPAYIRHMMNSAAASSSSSSTHADDQQPTLLVKIAGVYSIKVKDLKSNETRLKMNLMVLENLWAPGSEGARNIIKFDLKGIKDRRVKLAAPTGGGQGANVPSSSTTPINDSTPSPQPPLKHHHHQQQQQQQQQQALTIQVGELESLTPTSNDSQWSSYLQEPSHDGPTPIEPPGTGRHQPSGARERSTTTQIGHPPPPCASSNAHINGDKPLPQPKPSPSATAQPLQQADGDQQVWWDSEWIETFRPKAYVPRHQKESFDRALANDLKFLTSSNVMDYSLLLGVVDGRDQDEGRRPSFRCRIVDFLGAFTFAKLLESSSKKALKSGSEAKGNVTVLPPAEYASRFSSAIQSYFVPCPDNQVPFPSPTTSGEGTQSVSSGNHQPEKEDLSQDEVLFASEDSAVSVLGGARLPSVL
ncbi:hypothetical protein IE53DRAFT_287745 [Violaceomyces palustris]|uniref:Uncharacterized protein n=1 Tax=Violaceomyces palustris TaxID=1673888 RepID=A0ACD0P341_9BASI|nr:hypothetical protein IE53DRAFT_287745 [Violaceomyces palustris]